MFPYKNEGHNVFVESPAHSLLTVVQKKSKTTKGNQFFFSQVTFSDFNLIFQISFFSVTKNPLSLHAKDYILTENQLIKNDFIIPGLSKGTVQTSNTHVLVHFNKFTQ